MTNGASSARITIHDVARAAGVSISTVSRVLNGLDRVHPQTRQRVLSAVQELHYQPSAMARGLATQRTSALGFVIPNISDIYYMEIVRGVEEATLEKDYSLLVVSEPRLQLDQRLQNLFAQNRVDGVVAVGIVLPAALIDMAYLHGIPLAVVQQDLFPRVTSFLVDNYLGASELANHLLDVHHYERIGYIAGTNYTRDNAERLRALRDRLAEHGLDLPDELVAEGDYFPGSGYRAMQTLLDRFPNLQAVFAANDQMAADAMLAARDRGLRVPEDIAIVGFDDIAMASYIHVPLTTVHQPTYELGHEAAKWALDYLESPEEPSRKLLPAHLVVRRSCGCPYTVDTYGPRPRAV